MGIRRSIVMLSALILAAGCKKNATANGRDAGDAASDLDGSSTDASALASDDAAAAVPVATAAPTSTSVELGSIQPPALPFAGTYRCFNGMKLEQAGRIVTSTMHKGTTDTVLACTAGADTCTGTVREIQNIKGKPPKVNHVKPVTLTLKKGGDLVFVVGSAEKKGGGEQTFCPRR